MARASTPRPWSTAIRVYADNNPWDNLRGNAVNEWYIFGGIDTFPVYARYTKDELPENDDDIDWDSLNWSEVITNTVFLTVEGEGAVAEPEIGAPDTVTRGELVEVTVLNHDEESLGYHVEFDREADGWRTNRVEWDGNGSVWLNTENLPAGDYRILVCNHGQAGFEGRESFKDITVVDPEEPVFIIDKTDVETMEDFNFTIIAPGANAVRFCHEQIDNAWGEWWDDYAVGVNHCHDFYNYTFVAAATYDGGETWQEIGSITLNVSAPNGSLAQPEVRIEPAQPKADEDFTVTVSRVDNGGNVELTISNVQNEWDNIYADNMDYGDGDEVTFTIPAGTLEANHAYYVRTCVTPSEGVTGFDRAHTRDEFNVRGGDTAGTISLSSAEVLRNADCTVTVDVPGATTMQLYLGENEWRNVLGGHAEETFSRGQTGTYQIFARYSTADYVNEEWWKNLNFDEFNWNEFEWDGITGSAELTVTALGDLDQPEFRLSADTLPRGDMLTVQMTGDQHKDEWYGAHLVALDEWGHEEWIDGYNWDYEARAVYVPTANLPAGAYRLWVDVDAVGYNGNSASADITVTEPEGPVFMVDKAEALTQEPFNFTIYVPGATHFIVNLDSARGEDRWFDDEGDSAYSERSAANPGEYVFSLRWLDENEDWHTFENTVTVNVVAPYGWIDLPAPVFSGYVLEQGEGLTVDLNPDIELTYVDFWIDNKDSGEQVYATGQNAEQGWHFEVPGEALSDVGNYEVMMNLHAVGYESTVLSYSVLVEGPKHSSLVMQINGSSEAHQTFLVNEAFTVSTKGLSRANGVALYDGYRWRYYLGKSMSETISIEDVSTRVLYAKYTRQELPEEPDWENVTWTNIGNTITVTTTAEGRIPRPEVTLDKSEVVRGDVINVTVANPFEDANYAACVIRLTDNQWLDWYNWDGQGDVAIEVPTFNLEPGDYELYVNGFGCAGYQNEGASLNFTVTELEGGMSLTVSPAELITQQMANVYVVAPGATRIEAAMTKNGDEFWRNDWSWDEDQAWFEANSGGSGTYVMTATAYFPNGDTETRTQEMTITAPNGLLDVNIDMSGTLTAGEDLVFTVDAPNAEWGIVDVYDLETNECLYFADGVQLGEFSLSADSFAEGRRYVIYAYVAGEGWDENRVGKQFMVIGDIAGLPVMNLPAFMYEIGVEAFAGSAVQHVVIASGATTIGDRAFADCDSLVVIEIPDSVTSIAESAFEGSPYVTFICGENSTAAAFAAAHGITVR